MQLYSVLAFHEVSGTIRIFYVPEIQIFFDITDVTCAMMLQSLSTASTDSSEARKATSRLVAQDMKKQHGVNSLGHPFPPSHILQDGRFIYLPEPTVQERSVFLQRSIARHNLLNVEASAVEEEEEDKNTKKEEATEPRIHPLAVASARLQAKGIAELSKAINLSGLVQAGEFFGLSNVVDYNLLEITHSKDSSKNSTTASTTTNHQSKLAITGEHDESIDRRKSAFLGSRKRAQFIQAEQTLALHTERLAASVAAQHVVDRRFMDLRPRWRLVAPEHGTRAKPHPVQATEVVAMDVDVYDRDRTGGGVQNSSHQGMARKVPRYAVMEILPGTFQLTRDVQSWKRRWGDTSNSCSADDAIIMKEKEGMTENEMDMNEPSQPRTKIEPFAVLDPTMGKLDIDFDPDKVPMLTLQLDIEKDSTGFRQSVCLESISSDTSDDERVVMALQHSLFCASLFESIRTELSSNKVVWLSSAMETNYLPPPSVMAGGTAVGGRGALCVIHCHEGEVKVQLDSEYTLTIKLVEASTTELEPNQGGNDNDALSGSQSPAQLHALCRALLLHAQDVYHKYCIASTGSRKKVKLEKTFGHVLKSKEDGPTPARILQSTVGLGAKLILDRNIRLALQRIKSWLRQQQADATMTADWLPLSLFDLHSHFVLTCVGLTIDVSMERDAISVSRFGENGEYRRVDFYSHREFEIFLKMELQKILKSRQKKEDYVQISVDANNQRKYE